MKKLVSTVLALLMAMCVCLPGLAEAPSQDRAGNPITIPETVESIVSLAPSITQVLVDLGFGEKIVAIDTYSAGTIGLDETLPAFDMMAPDMEQIIALAPDVVFVTGMSLVDGSDPFAQLVEMGTCVAYIPSSTSIDGILADTLFIGQVVGDEAGAQGLNDALTEAIELLRVETDTPTSVYFEMGFPYTFGTGTFLNEMIEIVGGRNIFADQESWISVSDEAVIAANPEVIFTNVNWLPDPIEDITSREGWDGIAAVANDRIYQIDADASSQPNHRIIYALEEMAEALAK